MDDTKVKGCFKYGCIGCLSVFALVVGLAFLLGAVQMASDRDPEPEELRAEHPLPEPPPLPAYPGEDRPEVPPIGPLPEAALPAAVGRVVLDVRAADFEIVPGPENEPIRLEADYDKASFDLDEKLTRDDGGGWLYELTFGPRGGRLGFLFSDGSDRGGNTLRLVVPRGHLLDIVGRIGMGETEADLGGLWLGRVDLELGIGDHFVEFRDPLPVPAESFRLESSVGQIEVRALGNASPRQVEVRHKIGELTLDLEGSWRRDAEVDLHLTVGEMRVWLPKDVHVDLARASVGVGEKRERRNEADVPEGAPTLTIRARGSIGDLRIDG